jgi:hypothetical protein
MAYTKYSLTPANNTAAPPDGAPEGMLPSAVNDTMRDMMAQIRDCGDGIRGGTYTMTAPVITGGSINGTTIGATTASTGKFSTLTNSALTSGRVTYAGTSGVLQDDADFTFNGTTVTMANDASISGLTVGKGGGAVSTNTAVGVSALAGNSTGAYNTAVGYQAAFTATGNGISAFGTQALKLNTTGTDNAAFGGLPANAGNNAALYSNTTGSNNSAFGISALAANTTGGSNVGVGNYALQANTTASNNTAVGYQAGYTNTTGTQNVYLGNKAGYTSNANYNTFVGYETGITATGGFNTFLGYGAGYSMTTGTKNTILGVYNGNQGGLDIRTASNYIVLSDGDGNPRGYFDNNGLFNIINSTTNQSKMYISSSTASYTSDHIQSLSFTAAGTGWNHFIGYSNIGGTTNVKIQGNGNLQNANNSYGAISDIKLKENIVDATPKLDKLMQVKVRNYNLKGDYEQHKQLGVVAQELESVFPAMVDETVDKDKDGNDLGTTTKAVKYSVFVPMLIKAVQELNAKVEAQALEIATLKGQ